MGWELHNNCRPFFLDSSLAPEESLSLTQGGSPERHPTQNKRPGGVGVNRLALFAKSNNTNTPSGASTFLHPDSQGFRPELIT